MVLLCFARNRARSALLLLLFASLLAFVAPEAPFVCPAGNSSEVACTSCLAHAKNASLLCKQVPMPPSIGFCKLEIPPIMGCCAKNESWQARGMEPESWVALYQACDTLPH